MKQRTLEGLPERLIPWYEAHRRDLPWRADREAYHIWLSEIMLQQTRVEAVKGYYTRFLKELPTVEALAHCDDEHLHKLWEGLGYYSRVRNLKKAAQVIMSQYGGVFPQTYEQILALPGIGPYTAGAISSIAFDQPRAAVDGNVLRVMSRLERNEEPIDLPRVKAQVQRELEDIYPKQCPGSFTQALMELGATVCLPNGAPQCQVCPCADLCLGKDEWKSLPVKSPKREKKVEERTVFVLRCGTRYALEKRPEKGLLAGLWQFPNVLGHQSEEEALAWVEDRSMGPKALERQVNRTHIFTHIRWEMRGYYLEVERENPAFRWLTLEEMDHLAALPTAFRQFREEIVDV